MQSAWLKQSKVCALSNWLQFKLLLVSCWTFWLTACVLVCCVPVWLWISVPVWVPVIQTVVAGCCHTCLTCTSTCQLTGRKGDRLKWWWFWNLDWKGWNGWWSIGLTLFKEDYAEIILMTMMSVVTSFAKVHLKQWWPQFELFIWSFSFFYGHNQLWNPPTTVRQ